ncbi:hypothetical protein H4R34_003194 [Dimargaris verticillata]|uniref:Swiss Army Knife RNA repair protein HAD domain-containing protein n=1 Tax=Dimargaris verticillata TaxID=2761393 RepID=A0A9W8ECV6_9FUNG|nr:hypothetical protein H4R34_003194 [Dimargaris verticillata]
MSTYSTHATGRRQPTLSSSTTSPELATVQTAAALREHLLETTPPMDMAYLPEVLAFKDRYQQRTRLTGTVARPLASQSSSTSAPADLEHEPAGSIAENDAIPDPFSHLTTINIFDFDNTLYASPVPNPRLWDKKLLGTLLGTDIGWYHDARTLSPPLVVPTRAHFAPAVTRRAQQSIAHPQCLTVLLTGRAHQKFYQAVCGILAHGQLDFDMVFLKKTPPIPTPVVGQPISPLVSQSAPVNPLVSTLTYKLQVLDMLCAEFPSVTALNVWEDRPHHTVKFQQYIITRIEQGRLQHGQAIQVKPDITYLPKQAETALVRQFVHEYNQRQQPILDAILRQTASQSSSTSTSVSPTMSETAEPALSEQPSCPNLPCQVKFFRLQPITLQTSLHFSPVSLKHLQQRVLRLPRNWRHQPHSTLLCTASPTPDLQSFLDQAIVAAPPSHYPLALTVDRIGRMGSNVIVAGIALPPQLHSACFRQQPLYLVLGSAIPPQRLAFQHSVIIWEPLDSPITVRAKLVALSRTTVTEDYQPPRITPPKPPAAAVKVSVLLRRHHPQLQGRHFGQALQDIDAKMQELCLENNEANVAAIEDLVQTFPFDGRTPELHG